MVNGTDGYEKGTFYVCRGAPVEIGTYPKMNTPKCSLTKGKLLGEKFLYTLIYLVRSTRKKLVTTWEGWYQTNKQLSKSKDF